MFNNVYKTSVIGKFVFGKFSFHLQWKTSTNTCLQLIKIKRFIDSGFFLSNYCYVCNTPDPDPGGTSNVYGNQIDRLRVIHYSFAENTGFTIAIWGEKAITRRFNPSGAVTLYGAEKRPLWKSNEKNVSVLEEKMWQKIFRADYYRN